MRNCLRPLISGLCLLVVLGIGYCQEETTGPPAIVGGKRWAIVIGASAYEHYGKLNFAVNDAKAFASKLKSTFGFSDDTVKLLTDDAGPRMTPTAGHILGELAETLGDKRLDKGDLFIFYFSGHGSGIPSGDYLVPADARPETVAQLGVPVRKVVEQFVAAGLKNVLIICDACRSGASNPFGNELNQLAEKANIAVIQGCEPGQQSREDPKSSRGLFTNFLLKTMDDPTVRHPDSGALWAKALADKTSVETYKYGQRDYGKFAQKPISWTNAKRDILLGVFPSSNSGDAALKAFFSEAKKLSTDNYVAALNDYAVRLFELDNMAASIEAFKVLDQLGALSPDSRYVYSVALGSSERMEEVDQVLEKFGQGEADAYWRDLSIASTLSRKYSVDERLACAERVWESEKTWIIGYIRWVMLKYFGTPESKGPFLDELIKVEGLSKRQKAYIEAEILANQQKLPEAVKAFRATMKFEGDLPDEQFLRHSIHLVLAVMGDDDQLVSFLIESAKDKRNGYVWSMILAIHYQNEGQTDKMMAAIKQSMAGEISPEYLWVAVKTAGSRCKEIEADVARIAKTMPLAWKAQLAASVATGYAEKGVSGAISGFTSNDELFEKNAEYVFEGFKFLTQIIDEGMAKGELNGDNIQYFLQVAAAQMTQFADKLEQDEEFWLSYTRLMLEGERNSLLERVLDRQFDPVKSVASIRNQIRAVLLMAYVNAGASEKADAIMKAGGIPGSDQVDSQLMYASYLATEKRYAEARKWIPKRKDVTTSLQSLCEALEGLLLVTEGKKAEGKAIAQKLEETLDLQTQPMVALIYAELGDWDKASIGCNVSRVARAWGYGFIHFAAVREYYLHARTAGITDLIDVLAYECTVTQPGNRLFSPIYFGDKPEIQTYVGTYEFNLTGNSDWYQFFEGKVTLNVLPSGKVSGIFEPKTGEAIALGGTIDAHGVWTGKVKLGADECSIWSRLAPLSVMEKLENFKQTGHLIQLTKANQTRAVWLCKLIPAQRK